MDARQRFERTRRAVQRLNDVKLLIMYGCDDWRPPHVKAKNEKSDPTASTAIHNIDVLNEKLEELKREEYELENFIGTSLKIVRSVRIGLGDRYADMLDAYYIDGKSWNEISRQCKLAKTTCYDLAAVALDWVDSIGVSYLLAGHTEL